MMSRTTPFNKLTAAQAERLALLLEELGEAQQAIGKILRHGYRRRAPGSTGRDNRADLEKELGDVAYAVDLLCKSDDLSVVTIADFQEMKAERVSQYLHHQETPS